MATQAKLNLTAQELGPTAAAVRATVKPQQWRQIVNAAHKQGFAVDSFLDPNTPAPLKERTPHFLRQQALATVNTAYKPAYQEISQREARTQALSDKRATDNQYYLNWLNTQHQALTTGAQAADQALQGAVKTTQENTAAAYDQARQGAVQQLSQLPGTVSNFSNANALGSIDAHKATGVGEVGATGGQALAGIGTAQGMRELANANNFATVAALESKRVGDTWTAMQDLGGERLKLDSAKANDLSTQIQSSLDNEVKKAQSNRDYAAVTQKLGLQKQDTLSQIAARKAATTLNKSNAQLARDRLNETASYHRQLVRAKQDATGSKNSTDAANFEAKWGVSKDTFLGWSDAQRQSYLQRARARGVITGGKSTGKGGGAVGAAKITQGNYNKAYAKLFGGSYQTAGPKDPSTGKPTKQTVKFDPSYAQKNYDSLVNMLVAGGFDQSVADAAVNQFINSGGSGHPGSLNEVRSRIKSTKGPGGAH